MKAKRINGRFPSHNEHGEPVYYITQTCVLFCPPCANGENDSGAHTRPAALQYDMDRRVMMQFTHTKPYQESCDHCGGIIPGTRPAAPLATP